MKWASIWWFGSEPLPYSFERIGIKLTREYAVFGFIICPAFWDVCFGLSWAIFSVIGSTSILIMASEPAVFCWVILGVSWLQWLSLSTKFDELLLLEGLLLNLDRFWAVVFYGEANLLDLRLTSYPLLDIYAYVSNMNLGIGLTTGATLTCTD